MSKVYTQKQIRELEKLAIANGISGDEMMSRAGQAAFDLFQEVWPEAQSLIVVCGPGNNGGDGYVLARLAHESNTVVSVRYVGNIKKLSHEAQKAYEAAQSAGVDIQPWDREEPLNADVVADAFLGIGFEGELRDDATSVIASINEGGEAVFAIDAPSGLHVDTGVVASVAVQANVTLTFIGIKQGMLTAEGPAYCGDIRCADLDLPDEIFQQVQASAQAIDIEKFGQCLGLRQASAHKNNFGHVLIVGGMPGMGGASLLSALGAARVGAGLVSLATHPEHANSISVNQPEIMCHSVADSSELFPLLKKASVVVVGPGLGKSGWSRQILDAVLSFDGPMLVDADALNLLAKKPQQRQQWILTPHPGEAARLLGVTTQTIQANRFQAAAQLHEQYGGVIVLKGCGTIISNPLISLICAAGNPGMASGGMGDLLTGVIAGLVAQGLDNVLAAGLGVSLHACAADLAAEEGERGMLATDLLPYIRHLVNTV